MWVSIVIEDMNNLSKAANSHQQSQAHIRAEISLMTSVTSRIEFQLDQQRKKDIKHNELVKHNRKVVESPVDVVIYLASQEVPFRGHAEDKNSENQGNYVELVSLLGEYDVILGRHLQVVLNEIKNEISNLLFVAIISDETSDINLLLLYILNMRHYTIENENLILTGTLIEKIVCHPCSI